MADTNTVVRFENVSFKYEGKKRILEDTSFSVRSGMKMTIMGQNGAGKSTLMKLMRGVEKPEKGNIHMDPNLTIAIAHQVMPKEDLELTVRAFFEKQFDEKHYNIDVKIDKVLDAVNFKAPLDRIISSFSGGQQARLLLAAALIQDPDLLLLDEPTNNLDKEGIGHLIGFLLGFQHTCIVISHDADFLNIFTDGVLYLDQASQKVETYMGDYYNVVEEISRQIEKENMKNAQMQKIAKKNKEQANTFAHKGGKLRLVAKRMREKAEEMESQIVDVRREDKTIRDFTIPFQEDLIAELVKITSVNVIKDHEPTEVPVNISLRKNNHLLLKGPNGIGKSTLLESLATGTAKGCSLNEDLVVGYYRQDFSTLNFEETVWESLHGAMDNSQSREVEHEIRSTAAGFLITGDLMNTKIGHLSEGQKGLVAFARLVLQKPGLLILDEPTNHINFRHLPVIAKALDAYTGAMIIVSHVPEFLEQIRIDEELDLGRY